MLGRLFAGLRADPDQDESYTLNLLFPGLKQLPSRDFNPNLHLRVIIAHDTFTQRCRQPLYDSQPRPQPPPQPARKPSYKNLSPKNRLTCTYSSSSPTMATANPTSGGGSFQTRSWSPSNQSTPNLVPNSSSNTSRPSPLLWPASYIRLAEYIFGSVPVSYSGSITKLYPIPIDSNSISADPGRLCFLVVRIFSVPPGITPDNTSIRLSHSKNDSDWSPHQSPGDNLPRASGRSWRFAIAAILSLPLHDQHLLCHNWRDISMAMGELEHLVYFRISSLISAPLTPYRLQEDSSIIQACSYFSERLTSSFCALRLVCGQSRWREWAIALRAANSRILPNSNIQFLATTVTLFILYNSSLINQTGSTETPFVIVSSDRNLARRIIFILTSMITSPNGDDNRLNTAPGSCGSGPESSPSIASQYSSSPAAGITLRPVSSSSIYTSSPPNSAPSYCSSNEDGALHSSTLTPRSLRRISSHGWNIPRDRPSTSSLRSTLSGAVLSTSFSDNSLAAQAPPIPQGQARVSFPGKPPTNIINNNTSSRMLLSNALASLIGKTNISENTGKSSINSNKNNNTTSSPANVMYPELPKVEYDMTNDSINVPLGDVHHDYQQAPLLQQPTPRTIRSLRKVVMTNNLQNWNDQQTSAPLSPIDGVPTPLTDFLPQPELAVPYAGYRPKFSLNFTIQGCASLDDYDIKRAILQDVNPEKKKFLPLFGNEQGMENILGEYVAVNPDNRRISMYRVNRSNQHDFLVKTDILPLSQQQQNDTFTLMLQSVSRQIIQLIEEVPYKKRSTHHQVVMHDTSSVEDGLHKIISSVLDFLHTL